MKYIIQTPFTGLGAYNGFRGDEWLVNRINLFVNYTLQSLINQTDKDFIHWITWRKEEKDNESVKQLGKYLDDIGYNYIFTFEGLPRFDDKNPENNKKLKEVLKRCLEKFGTIEEDVLLADLGSDDMYASDFIETVKKEAKGKKEKTAFIRKKGYVYKHPTRELAEWNPRTNPPFYAILLKGSTFSDPEKLYDILKNITSHEDITELFKTKELPDWKYCVLVHGDNISTTWEHSFKGEKKEGKERKDIINSFGFRLMPELPEGNGKRKVYVAVLNEGDVREDLSRTLNEMKNSPDYDVYIDYPADKPISNNRNKIVQAFLASGYDYLLMIDDDVVPPSSIIKMADYQKDIMASLCFMYQQNTVMPVVFNRNEDGLYNPAKINDKDGIIEVDGAGTGCIMLSRKVLKDIKAPFQNEYDPDGIKLYGLDIAFCRKAKKKGYKVYANLDYASSHWQTLDLKKLYYLITKFQDKIKDIKVHTEK